MAAVDRVIIRIIVVQLLSHASLYVTCCSISLLYSATMTPGEREEANWGRHAQRRRIKLFAASLFHLHARPSDKREFGSSALDD
jgi:hypothetical protein